VISMKRHFPRMSGSVRPDDHFGLAQLLMIGSVGSGAVSVKDQPPSPTSLLYVKLKYTFFI
jgi:hypothetical protein